MRVIAGRSDRTEADIRELAERLQRKLDRGLLDNLRLSFRSFGSAEIESVAALPILSVLKWRSSARLNGAEIWILIKTRVKGSGDMGSARLLAGEVATSLRYSLGVYPLKLMGSEYDISAARFYYMANNVRYIPEEGWRYGRVFY